MTKEAARINYDIIDIARFVMSILVIAIHVDTFYPIQGSLSSALFRDITGIAVPFFFVTSGFFFQEKGECHSRQYILKLLKAYVCWTAVYIPLTAFYYWGQSMSVVAVLLQFVQRFILVGENFYSFQLWYLPALVCSVVLYQLGIRILLDINVILLISVLLFVGGRTITFLSSGQMELPLISSMARLYFCIFVTTRNGMFYGFAFFMVGVWISDNLHRLGRGKVLPLLVVGFISACLNHFGLFFMMVPEIACLWIVLQKASNVVIVSHSGIYRRMSEWNYYIHLWPLSVMSFLIKGLDFWSGWIVVSFITVAITAVIVSLRNKASTKDICGEKL